MVELWNEFVLFFVKLLTSVFLFAQDMFFWVLDQVFTIGQSMLNVVALGLENINPLLYVNAIPEETKGMMSLVGFNESMAIIISAVLLRFTIQMIPFVRWGS